MAAPVSPGLTPGLSQSLEQAVSAAESPDCAEHRAGFGSFYDSEWNGQL